MVKALISLSLRFYNYSTKITYYIYKQTAIWTNFLSLTPIIAFILSIPQVFIIPRYSLNSLLLLHKVLWSYKDGKLSRLYKIKLYYRSFRFYVSKMLCNMVFSKLEAVVIKKLKNLNNKYISVRKKPLNILLYKKESSKRCIISGKYIYTAAVITFLVLVKLLYTYYGPVFSTFVITTMLLAMPTLLLLQTMTFLYKTYRISKYTTANQKFWKRTLMVFWVIEAFLFVILLFIALNAPENLKAGTNHNIFMKQSIMNDGELYDSFIVTSSVLLLSTYMLFLKKNKPKFALSVAILTSVCLIWYTVISEYGQLLMCLNKSSKLSLMHRAVCMSPQYLYEVGSIESKVREDLVSNNLKLLLIFLKFWHVIFIALFTAFKVVRYIEYGKLSYDSLSAMVYNASFLVWFNVLFLILQKKKLMYLFLMKPSSYYFFQNYLNNTVAVITIITNYCTS